MDSSRKAILLTSNFISKNDEQHYQKMLLGAEDLFVHTWSLSVEMQWYLIIPAIFVVQRLATSWEKTFFAGIAGCSITFYFGADNTTAFYSTFARLWQFLCGVAAFLAQDKTLHLLGGDVLAYVGDISYPLYLFHWPVYVIVKPHSLEQPLVLFFGVLASGTLAIATHHGLESRYSKWSPPAISLLVALLLVSSSALSYRLHNQDDLVGEFGPGPVNYSSINVNDAAWNMTLMQYINTKEGNQTLNMETPYCERSKRFDEKDVPPGAFCETQNGTGAYSILVIGNSYAFNQGGEIYNAFKNQSRELNLFSFSGCEFLTESDRYDCHFQNYNYSFIINALKPDILFVITRPFAGRKRFDPLKPIDEDKMFNDYMNRMNQVEGVAKKVYLLQALPTFVLRGCSKGLEFTSNKRPLRDIKDGLIKREEVFARARITEVGKRCKKCEIIDYLPFLVDDDGQFLGYNPKTNIMYFDDSVHFNRFGRERIQTLYTKLAEELYSKGIQ
ncbi:hypothetical protein Aduo_011347 [Ancylostoma duodenale]